ncbi:MAG: sodium:calcium antiporter [Bacteriovoracaceae bacterium]
MLLPFLQFFLSALVIIIAGTFLVRFADQISDITKLGRLFVGSVFLASATSLPELLVDLSAVKNNMPDLAVGDLIGSSVFNLMILAIADLLHKGKSPIFSQASSRHAISGAMSISVTAIAGISIFLEPRLFNFSIGEIGLGPIAIAVSYILGLRLIYFDQKITSNNQKIDMRDIKAQKFFNAVTGYLISALFILIAAPVLAEAGGKIAKLSGLGNTFVGTTLIALSTSLPELVSTISAVRKGSFDLALGNIFGSNTFNMLLLVPLDMIFKGSLLGAVNPIHIFTCFSTILITSIAVMGQLYQVEQRKKIIEPDALVVIFLVILANCVLYILR